MKFLYPFTFFILLLVVCIAEGCSDRERDSRFEDIERRIEADPEAAVRYVDSLNADKVWKEGMNAAERARFDLLRIKSADKAYVRHTSDSLIRSVLAYYEKHTGSEQYPEALYYGGRVYSDLGDSPTSLRYFQQALDALPEKSTNMDLRCRILSQTGRLLSDLRLHDEAISYINRLLDLEYATGDSINIMYNLELLGIIYNRKKDYISADSLFRESLYIARHCDSNYVKREKVFIAKALLDKGLIDSALNLIRNIPVEIAPKYKPQALPAAAEIYFRAEKYDTAATYAKKLARQHNSSALRRTGYNIIFKPAIVNTLSRDSLDVYIQDYVSLTNEYLERNSNELTAIQNSKYNYRKHDDARAKAEKEKIERDRLLWIIATLFFAFVTFAVIVRNRKQRELISLQMSLVELEKIKNHYLYKELITEGPEEKSDPERIRNAVRKRVLSLYEKQKHCVPQLDEVISGSEVYLKLRNLISEGKSLSSENEKQIWSALEYVILQASPNFKKILTALVDGSLSKNSMEIAMLIRCHFTPSEISILLGRAKNSVSTRRQVLRSKIFENINDNEILDGVIWLL